MTLGCQADVTDSHGTFGRDGTAVEWGSAHAVSYTVFFSFVNAIIMYSWNNHIFACLFLLGDRIISQLKFENHAMSDE